MERVNALPSSFPAVPRSNELQIGHLKIKKGATMVPILRRTEPKCATQSCARDTARRAIALRVGAAVAATTIVAMSLAIAPLRAVGAERHCVPEVGTALQSVALRADTQVKVPIEDPSGSLRRFHLALAELAAGKRDKVRIAYYGDSNNTKDWASGTLRSRLGALFGYGGHGFIAAGQPWDWYHHAEINVEQKRGWTARATSTPRYSKAYYGHHGILGKGTRRGGMVVYYPQHKGDAQNRRFSRLRVHYLCGPRLGRIAVEVDGEQIDEINTRCEKLTYSTKDFRVSEDEHEVRLKVTAAPVYVFGASFENDQPGVVVDGMGVNSLSIYHLSKIAEDQFVDGLKSRNYDLVIIHLGTNLAAAPRQHRRWSKIVIDRARKALGDDVPILFLSPPDYARRGIGRSQKRMITVTREKREIAHANGIAFWDYFNAMGGHGSIFGWHKKGLVSGDLLHLQFGLHDVMATKLAGALMAETAQDWRATQYTCLARTFLASAEPARAVASSGAGAWAMYDDLVTGSLPPQDGHTQLEPVRLTAEGVLGGAPVSDAPMSVLTLVDDTALGGFSEPALAALTAESLDAAHAAALKSRQRRNWRPAWSAAQSGLRTVVLLIADQPVREHPDLAVLEHPDFAATGDIVGRILDDLDMDFASDVSLQGVIWLHEFAPEDASGQGREVRLDPISETGPRPDWTEAHFAPLP